MVLVKPGSHGGWCFIAVPDQRACFKRTPTSERSGLPSVHSNISASQLYLDSGLLYCFEQNTYRKK